MCHRGRDPTWMPSDPGTRTQTGPSQYVLLQIGRSIVLPPVSASAMHATAFPSSASSRNSPERSELSLWNRHAVTLPFVVVDLPARGGQCDRLVRVGRGGRDAGVTHR